MTFTDIFNELKLEVIPFTRTIAIIIVLFIIFSFTMRFIKIKLLSKVANRGQKSNIELFSRFFNIIFLIFIIIVGFFSYVGSFTGLGIAAGLFTAALGWALQRPITGIAAWVMVVFKRPFYIGDRIIIGDIKGDVKEITLTHIILDEIGGIIDSEVPSGRVIMVPNYLLYELSIINYTKQHDFIIGESIVQVTYESDLDKAIKIAYNASTKFTKDSIEKLKIKPMIRISMAGSGIDIKVRFYGIAYNIQKITSDITKEIYDKIKNDNSVEIAYPHSEVIFNDKNLFYDTKK